MSYCTCAVVCSCSEVKLTLAETDTQFVMKSDKKGNQLGESEGAYLFRGASFLHVLQVET